MPVYPVDVAEAVRCQIRDGDQRLQAGDALDEATIIPVYGFAVVHPRRERTGLGMYDLQVFRYH
jgi:hypothetical protein